MKLDSAHPYDRSFKEQLDAIFPDLSSDLGRASELQTTAADLLISLILERVCQCQNLRNITLGRETAAAIPRLWFLERIERVAEHCLDLDNDEWEYRRFLEMVQPLDSELFMRLIHRGLTSHNPEIIEAAKEHIEANR